ncbi:hypothetical protein FGB62_6g47 [Gracilaria domingensis]|nr:hypothetical protein FGB62_6g47 [Gracilaria domingensis]
MYSVIHISHNVPSLLLLRLDGEGAVRSLSRNRSRRSTGGGKNGDGDGGSDDRGDCGESDEIGIDGDDVMKNMKRMKQALKGDPFSKVSGFGDCPQVSIVEIECA